MAELGDILGDDSDDDNMLAEIADVASPVAPARAPVQSRAAPPPQQQQQQQQMGGVSDGFQMIGESCQYTSRLHF